MAAGQHQGTLVLRKMRMEDRVGGQPARVKRALYPTAKFLQIPADSTSKTKRPPPVTIDGLFCTLVFCMRPPQTYRAGPGVVDGGGV